MLPRRIFIGHDTREQRAYDVCVGSMRAHSSVPLDINPVSSLTLPVGMYTRPQETRDGVMWDVVSDAPMSTQFSIARFYIPCLVDAGWVLFCDCDFLWRGNVEELFRLRDDKFAVMVVQHHYVPQETVKMDGQIQTAYPRKNWSSLMLLNCSAPEVRALVPDVLNETTGRCLHGFGWVEDYRIGAIPHEWNWLEGTQAQAVHYTRGTPDMAGYEGAAYHEEWWKYVHRDAV